MTTATTLAFAPTPDDLDEYLFEAPVLMCPDTAEAVEEPEQGEP